MAWQPIQTAPKDGTRILLGTTDYQESARVSEGEWFNDVKCWSTFWDPTHWQPMPDGPTA